MYALLLSRVGSTYTYILVSGLGSVVPVKLQRIVGR